ncbi:MAG: ACP S-malonyltransferase [bacterium]|nr:ACP S-malonyltransferase [bacterium]
MSKFEIRNPQSEIRNGKIAFIFPGQGAQYVGMGRDVYESSPVARDAFTQASEVLGYDLAQICFHGPAEILGKTKYTQVAVFTTSIAILRAIGELLPHLRPTFVAGHSLGEYSALVAAGGLNFGHCLQVVQIRAEAMEAAAKDVDGGGMSAVLGLGEAEIVSICHRVSQSTGTVNEGVWPVNFNSQGQVVIAGSNSALEQAEIEAKEAGAKRVIRLSVSGPFHTPLIKDAQQKLASALNQVEFFPLEMPLITNVGAVPIKEPEQVKDSLIRQVVSPVCWEQSIRLAIQEGVTTFIEIGPGKVLTGLMKRIDRSVQAFGVENLKEIGLITGN